MSATWQSKLSDIGPVSVFLITFVLLISGLYSSIQLLGSLQLSPSYFINYLILYPLAIIATFLYIYCTLQGPGFVPLKWFPFDDDNRKYLEYCRTCEGYKPPRSHHCRRCGRCILKLDHHCAFINGCVGHKNEITFIWCLFFELLVFLLSFFLNLTFLCEVKNKTFVSNPALLPISIYTRYLVILGSATAIGSIFFISVIFAVQIKRLVKNRTFIEESICSKANQRRQTQKDLKPFIFPFDLGWRKNISLMTKCVPSGNGYDWPVIEGCSQYSISVEHMEQKKESQQKFKIS